MRYRLTILGIIIVAISTCFIIFQTELRSKQDNYSNVFMPQFQHNNIVNRIDFNSNDEVSAYRNNATLPGASEEIVKQLIEKYRFNITAYPVLARSVWDVAADWMTPLQILPDVAPELGS